MRMDWGCTTDDKMNKGYLMAIEKREDSVLLIKIRVIDFWQLYITSLQMMNESTSVTDFFSTNLNLRYTYVIIFRNFQKPIYHLQIPYFCN